MAWHDDDIALAVWAAYGGARALGLTMDEEPPVTIDGHVLMDGGVVNNTPLSHAISLGAERIWVLPTGFACAEVTSGAVDTVRSMHVAG